MRAISHTDIRTPIRAQCLTATGEARGKGKEWEERESN